MKRFYWLGMLAVSVFIHSCTSSRITSVWKAPDAPPATFQKIMVIGIIRDADRTIRQNMEAHLAADLRDLGYNSFSAYEQYGPKAFENMTEQQVNEQLAKEGIDAALTIVLLDKQKERSYVPGRIVYTPYITYHDRFYRYYRTVYMRIETPDYYVSTKYFWESNFYNLRENKLICSVQTQSFDPDSAEGLGHEYGQLILSTLMKNNVLEKQQNKLAVHK